MKPANGWKEHVLHAALQTNAVPQRLASCPHLPASCRRSPLLLDAVDGLLQHQLGDGSYLAAAQLAKHDLHRAALS